MNRGATLRIRRSFRTLLHRSLAIGWILFAPLAGQAAGTGWQQVQQRGVLRWGGDIQGGEPFVFRDGADHSRLVGFEVDIAAGLGRRLGLTPEFVQNDWQNLLPSLKRGDFDIVLNGFEITPARSREIAMSRPYYAFDELLVVRRDQPEIELLEDLEGRRVGTLNGSLAREILAEHPEIQTVLYEGVEEPYIDLEQGRLEGVLLDHIIAERYGLVHTSLRRAAVVGRGAYGIGVRREEPELLEAIDHALQAMIDEGELQAILTRWNLWNERQVGLREAIPAAAAVEKPASKFDGGQLWLFLRGAAITIVISSLAMILAVGGGLFLSVCRHYGSPLTSALAATYVEIFRGTPVLLQLYVLYYGLAPVWTLDAFTAAVLGLGLNYAAYEAEIYRAGIQAVPIGQTEAALALGMSRRVAMQRIILPQAVRVALPGIANDFIALLKDSSLVSVITVVELTKQMTISAVDMRGWLVPGLVCAAFYLAMSLPLSRLARRLEQRLAPGHS